MKSFDRKGIDMSNSRLRQLDFLAMQMNMIGTYLDLYYNDFDSDLIDFTRPKLIEMRNFYGLELRKLKEELEKSPSQPQTSN